METAAKLALLKDRLQKLENSAKNIKSTGVVRKIRIQIRDLQNA